MISKTYDFEVKQVGNEEDRILRFTGTSEAEDRDFDVLLTNGWNWDNYMKNPLFLAMHDYNKLPVGKTLRVIPDSTARKTSFLVKFPTIEELSTNPKTPSEHALFADTVYRMYKFGYLNAVSIGFRGIEWEPRTASNGMQGRLYKQMEAFELSAVTVPANPGALIEARSKGVISNCQYDILMKNGKGGIDEIDLEAIKLPDDDINLKSIDLPAGEINLDAIQLPKGKTLDIEGLKISEDELRRIVRDTVQQQLRKIN